MKSILIIGLGRFGRHIAMKLDELHHHVMAVDKEDTRVDAVLPFVTNAQIGDATNEDFLGSIFHRDACKSRHLFHMRRKYELPVCQPIKKIFVI